MNAGDMVTPSRTTEFINGEIYLYKSRDLKDIDPMIQFKVGEVGTVLAFSMTHEVMGNRSQEWVPVVKILSPRGVGWCYRSYVSGVTVFLE